MPTRFKIAFWPLVVFLAVSMACNYPTAPAAPPPTLVAATDLATAAPAVPTAAPARLLTVCMGQEPVSLFLYADGSAAARAVRQAIYDGPVDIVNYQLSPVILESIPGLNSGVTIEPVSVQAGNTIVDVNGRLVQLGDGVRLLPAGCSDASCAVDFSAQTPLQMDAWVVRFRIRAGVQWSDGQLLTADDSVYSYELARAMYPNVRAELIDRTIAYTAIDAQTVEWRGLPGYRSSGAAAHFFTPLPRHAWGSLGLADLLASEAVNRQTLGWGPYQIDEWVAGDHLTLSRNPAYFRLAEGLPAFDKLVFRFVPDPEQALTALQAGECDYLDETLHLETRLEQVAALQNAGKAVALTQTGSAWEHLDFGIQPANPPESGGPLPFFGSAAVRQAAASCIDRSRMAAELLYGKSAVVNSYLPENHPLFNPDVIRYAFDPTQAGRQLEAAGWRDADGDPSTPRVAQGVAGIPDGTAFEVTLLTTDEAEKGSAALIVQESLAQCGIRVQISAAPTTTVFAAGPAGPVFGRNFNLAQFGWVSATEPPCFLYTTAEIPGPSPDFPKGWGGANASGYSNPEYDRLCAQARSTLPDDPVHRQAHLAAQALFAQELPALPLYLRLKQVVTRPDFCGLTGDPSAETVLSNLENFNYGEVCP